MSHSPSSATSALIVCRRCTTRVIRFVVMGSGRAARRAELIGLATPTRRDKNRLVFKAFHFTEFKRRMEAAFGFSPHLKASSQ
jgi:hypothetical protein